MATFARERKAVVASSAAFCWLRPGDRDPDRTIDAGAVEMEFTDDPMPAFFGAGRQRGLVIHKLIEEILPGELAEVTEAAALQAAERLRQLDPARGLSASSDPEEMAVTALAALALPDVAALRSGLLAEVAIRAILHEEGERRPVDGRADAVFVDRNGSTVIVDWNSDVDPDSSAIAVHLEQMSTSSRRSEH